MANHKSAEKRARQALKRRDRNRIVRGSVRTQAKTVLKAIDAGDAETARSQLRLAEREYRKATSKGVLKKTTASRKISRLAKAVNAVKV